MSLNTNRILASNLPQIFSCEKCGNKYYAGFGDYGLICLPSIIAGIYEYYAVSKCDQCGNEIFCEIPKAEYDSLIFKKETKQ